MIEMLSDDDTIVDKNDASVVIKNNLPHPTRLEEKYGALDSKKLKELFMLALDRSPQTAPFARTLSMYPRIELEEIVELICDKNGNFKGLNDIMELGKARTEHLVKIIHDHKDRTFPIEIAKTDIINNYIPLIVEFEDKNIINWTTETLDSIMPEVATIKKKNIFSNLINKTIFISPSSFLNKIGINKNFKLKHDYSLPAAKIFRSGAKILAREKWQKDYYEIIAAEQSITDGAGFLRSFHKTITNDPRTNRLFKRYGFLSLSYYNISRPLAILLDENACFRSKLQINEALEGALYENPKYNLESLALKKDKGRISQMVDNYFRLVDTLSDYDSPVGKNICSWTLYIQKSQHHNGVKELFSQTMLAIKSNSR